MHNNIYNHTSTDACPSQRPARRQPRQSSHPQRFILSGWLIRAVFLSIICSLGTSAGSCASPRLNPGSTPEAPRAITPGDTVLPFDFIYHRETGMPEFIVLGGDTIRFETANSGPLTENDYREVAEALGVEVAAIKAVVEIEAGQGHKGFWAPNKPILNFDMTMFRKFAAKAGINLGKYSRSHPEVFSRPNVARYGNRLAAVAARFDKASEIDPHTAIFGTFWGMFQIGGFNWKKCGTSSPEEFVMLMSRSERDQLDLFAAFLRSTGLDKHLRSKNWSAFARGYNGPSYASRGYHTRLARAYNKFSQTQS